MTATNERLIDYFKNELQQLRDDAAEFAGDHPAVAQELGLNNGRSRDPHIEMLVQSFAWMTGRLHQKIEHESAKLPELLMQQLYPQLIAPLPSMAVMECDVDGFAADFSTGYPLSGGKVAEPFNIQQQRGQNKLAQCRFSTCHGVRLWPYQVSAVNKPAFNNFPRLEQPFPRGRSLVEITLNETSSGAADGLLMDQPLRFCINLPEQQKHEFYDFLFRHYCGAVLLDGDGEILARLDKHSLTPCGFADDERLFPAGANQDLALSVLHDYFSFPDKFMFFEIAGFGRINFRSGLRILLVCDENLPLQIQFNAQSLRLNCVPVINLFEKTSEPLPLTLKECKYKLIPSREHYDCHEVYKVNEVYAINRHGETEKLTPFFSLNGTAQLDGPYRWLAQSQASQKKRIIGSETFLSVHREGDQALFSQGETLYAKLWCTNRSACELFDPQQSFAILGSSPVKQMRLLSRPTRYKRNRKNRSQLWQLLSHLTTYYVALTDRELARSTLVNLLGLYADPDNPMNLRQIESIESFTAEDDVMAVRNNGWRGYYHGTRFSLTLIERKHEGSSAVLFGQVLHHFLALFSHINSFVSLELWMGNKKLCDWPAKSGHKALA